MKKNFSVYSDRELVRLLREIKEDSEFAFKELYDRYSSNVHAYCLRVMGSADQAEDIFQETFIKFYQNVKVDTKETNVPGFLITIARNFCLNQKRKKQKTVTIDDMDFMGGEQQNYENRELLGLIATSLELLDFEFREAFVMREYNGMPYKDIAEITGITVANAKSRVFRAKQKIKTILQPYLKDLAK